MLKTEPEESSYLSGLPVLKHLRSIGGIEFKKPVTFLVGENGTGKSTLLEAIAVSYGFNPEGGSRNFCFSTFESHSELYRLISLWKGKRPKDGFFLRAESFFNVATKIEELDEIPAASPSIKESYGGKSLHEQSHGESFMALAENRFGGNGLYILDEPEAALSPLRQMSLLVILHELVKNNSQLIIATHSPILMSYPDADIYVLDDKSITLTPCEETEHFTITREFLNHKEKMLKNLLD